MIDVDFVGWKRFIEGRRRGDIGPYQRRNYAKGADCFVEFINRNTVVARMTVYDSNTDKPSADCERKYEVTKKIRDKTSGIYIPTDEQWEKWDEEDRGTDDTDPFVRAAEFDKGWLK